MGIPFFRLSAKDFISQVSYKICIKIFLLTIFFFIFSYSPTTHTSFQAISAPYDWPPEPYDNNDSGEGGMLGVFTGVLVLLGYPIFFISSYIMLKKANKYSSEEVYAISKKISWKRLKELSLLVFFMGSIILILEMFLLMFIRDYIPSFIKVDTSIIILLGSFIVWYLFCILAGIQSNHIDIKSYYNSKYENHN